MKCNHIILAYIWDFGKQSLETFNKKINTKKQIKRTSALNSLGHKLQ